MRRLKAHALVVSMTSAVLLCGTDIAMAEEAEAAPAVGHGFHTGTVPLNTTFNGDMYELIDPVHGNAVHYNYRIHQPPAAVFTDVDNDWGAGSGVSTRLDPQTMAVDAQYAVGKAWDYFAQVHGRNGIAGDGKGVDLYGGAPGWSVPSPTVPEYQSATADRPARLAYGQGQFVGSDGYYRQLNPATLDLMGGAFARGVGATAAGLPGGSSWDTENSAIAESNAHIFGTLIEFYANNRVDPPDYLIRERVATGEQANLNIAAPISMANAANNCFSPTAKTSAVGDHFFYLLAVGSNSAQWGASKTCNGLPVTGIGNDKAAKIWYRALTQYFTGSTTGYATARLATLKAAADLYGAHGLEYNTVNSAWAGAAVVGAHPTPGEQTPYPVNPGDQGTIVRTAVSLQIAPLNPAGRPLTYFATGLPPGLTMNPATGLITGAPTAKGEYRVTVAVTDTVHAQGSTWFMWYVT